MTSSSSRITELLVDWSKGDERAFNELLPLVEHELRRQARGYRRRFRPGNTLQTTALINEAYIRLVDQDRVQWQNRAHFYGIAASMMRRIVINYIRDGNRQKRGGGAIHISLSGVPIFSRLRPKQILALDEALVRFAEFDLRKSRVVEMRFFGGLSIDEIAEVLSVSRSTVDRDWAFAKTWLLREISDDHQ